MTPSTGIPEVITLTPRETADALTYMLRTKRSVVLWGDPGVSKSSLTAQAADTLFNNGVHADKPGYFIDTRLVLMDPVEMKGLPYVKDGRDFWTIPGWLPDQNWEGILLLDEFNRAPQLVQNAALQLIYDRRLGAYEFPEKGRIVMCCNPETDGGVVRMSGAANNRVVHINVKPDIESWRSWALDNNIDPLVIAYLSWRSENLHKYDRKEHAYPTPRSWEFVSDIIKTNPSQQVELALIAGTVGRPVGVEFMAFLRMYRGLGGLIDSILLNPDSAEVPTSDPSKCYAIARALSDRMKVDNFAKILTYLDRMPQEYAVFSVKVGTQRDSTLTQCAEYVAWGIKHQDFL